MFVPNFSIFLYTDGSQIWSLNLPNTRYELILIYSVKKKIQRHVLAQFDPQCMGSVTLILYTKSNPIHKNVGLSMGLMPGGGGGGYYHIAYWVDLCAARETKMPWMAPSRGTNSMPGGGGGGGYYHIAYWVDLCAARETPIFSPEFPFRSM